MDGSSGEPGALFPRVYDELRKLAAGQLANERPGQSLDATALVHEAYLRLCGRPGSTPPAFRNRAHFFAAAAEAMRRILIDHARALRRETRRPVDSCVNGCRRSCRFCGLH
jgi:RNA polymerase sigma factor (TIGR02999 family)